MVKISIVVFFALLSAWNVKAKWTKLNHAPVCFEGRNNRPGHMMYMGSMGGSGHLVGAMKLVWKEGVIRCESAVQYNSKWGCYQHRTFTKYPFNVIVTDGKDSIIYPTPEYIKHAAGLWYYLPGQDEKNSNEIVFSNFDTPFYLHNMMNLKLWYGEDLKNWAETDNQGRVCVDVHVWPVVESSGGSSAVNPSPGGSNKAIGILTDLKSAFDKIINKGWM